MLLLSLTAINIVIDVAKLVNLLGISVEISTETAGFFENSCILLLFCFEKINQNKLDWLNYVPYKPLYVPSVDVFHLGMWMTICIRDSVNVKCWNCKPSLQR